MSCPRHFVYVPSVEYTGTAWSGVVTTIVIVPEPWWAFWRRPARYGPYRRYVGPGRSCWESAWQDAREWVKSRHQEPGATR